MQTATDWNIEKILRTGARHYRPLPIVISSGSGVWLCDIEGRRYLDCLSAYSAVNQGHCHPRLVKAMETQIRQLTLASSAVYNNRMVSCFELLGCICGKDKVLLMNSGAEAVETAVKVARKWGYTEKGVPLDQAEIIVFDDNFHGRTTTVVSFSSCDQYRHFFGPHTPGFKLVPYGDFEALSAVVTNKTVAVLIEPIQGEGGIHIPPHGYLNRVRELCTRENILMLADEIQSGLGRTGRWFACDHEAVVPDVYILGKALSGGFYPVSAVVANQDILGVLQPGDHGSTYGANPVACALVKEALAIIVDERLIKRSAEMGEYAMCQFRTIRSPHIKEVRGRGLFVGIELTVPARPFCERLAREGEIGLICKETHDLTLRFTPPLTIERQEVDFAMRRIAEVLA